MLGSLKLPLWGWKYFTVYGGPYLERPTGMLGVKLAKEIKAPSYVKIDTPDFGVPNKRDARAGLWDVLDAITHGDPVYVGCMGGRGRTGLFLAILAKAFGVKNPVEYVRENYYEHAVETERQYQFVEEFEIDGHIKRKVAISKFFSLFSLRNNLTIP